MGYRIEYDGRIGKYEVQKEHPWSFPTLIMAALGVFAVLTYLFWPEGQSEIQSVLIPGEDTVTVQAFQNMTADLRSGASVSEAVYAFCRYVIHGA